MNLPPIPPKGSPDEMRFAHMVTNILSMRRDMIRQTLDQKRDIFEECQYPKGPQSVEYYRELYDRHPLAARVVEVYPKESWQIRPTVYEKEKAEAVTDFEKRWDSLGMNLEGEDSWFEEEEGSPVWDLLRRADEASRVGRYGGIYVAIDDGLDPSKPAKMFSKGESRKGTQRKLLYMSCFSEDMARISRYDDDRTSRRFGRPVEYDLSFSDPRELALGEGYTVSTQKVHWTRFIHLADNCKSSQVLGTPSMEPVLNPLLDARKLYGGSAEMYWKGAFFGLSFSTHPQLGTDVTVDPDTVRDQMEQFMQGLQRYLMWDGGDVKSLAPQVVDPTPQIAVQIEAICIKLGIPVRVFKGSERGQLASSQDAANWNDRLRERQKGYLTPRVVRPFTNRLIALGVLPEPQQVRVWWPDITSQSETEKGDVALKRSQAMAQYIQSDSWKILAPMDFLTRIIGFNEEEALACINSAKAFKGSAMDLVSAIQPQGQGSGRTPLSREPSVNGAAA